MKQALFALAALAIITGCSRSDDDEPRHQTDTTATEPATTDLPNLDALLVTINSDAGEGWLSLSPDNRTAIFSRQIDGFGDQRIFFTVWEGDNWSEPGLAPFAADVNERGARFAPDGQRIYFASTRPDSDDDSDNDWNVWSVDLDDDGTWREPESLAGLNSPQDDFHPSVTADGVIYFGSPRDGGLGRSDLYVGRQGVEGWTLEPTIDLNSEFSEPDPFIAPDSSYVIFARTGAPDGLGGDDLYVSFASDHGWSEPRNLGEAVNTPEYEYGAFVTSDGVTLFYTTWASGTPQVASVELSRLDTGL